jgi:hypothetical protein
MVFGAETDERFGWTRFDVLPKPVESVATPSAEVVSAPLSGAGWSCDGISPLMITHATAKRIGTNAIVMYWPTVTAGEVSIRYRELGATEWQNALRNYPNIGIAPIGFLKSGAKYEYQIVNGFGCAQSPWSPVFRSF